MKTKVLAIAMIAFGFVVNAQIIHESTNGNVGIGTTTPTEGKVVIKHQASPGLSGNKTGALTILGYNTELAIGASNLKNGGSWIQTRHRSTTYDSYAYPLSLNPLGGNVNIGTSEASSSRLNILAKANSYESFFRAKISDAINDEFLIQNATGTSGQFIPNIVGKHTSDNRGALYLTGSIGEANDTGNNPVMVFDSRIESKSIMNRPLFGWDSYGQRKMTLTAKGKLGIGTSIPTEAKVVIKDQSSPSLSGNKTGALAILGRNTELAIGASDAINGGSWIQTRHTSATYSSHAYPLALNPLGGNVNIGTSEASSSKLNILAKGSSYESFFRAKISDAINDEFLIQNATGTNGQFIPNIVGKHTSDNRSALFLTGSIGESNDTGDKPIMTFDSRIVSKNATVRPLFGWNSYGQRKMTLTAKGELGIGTETTGIHKLAVEGSIGAREIKVQATGWSDFVFKKEYKLPTLTEVENHIKEKGHLENIPSAKEVKKDGFFLGQMDAKLLQKIEELTLYTIDQEKKLNTQNTKIEKQQKQIDKLSLLVTKLLNNKNK